jgi:CopG family transcriptional regulator, nickel-responsive regulator
MGGCVLSELIRFGISMDKKLLERLDKEIVMRGYPNRSEAIRDLIRNQLVELDWSHEEEEVAGTITIIYNHHIRGLSDLLLELQHQHHAMIISVMHVHLEHDNCLEVMVIRGKAAEARELAGRLIGVKGVKHGKLTITSTGTKLD